MKNFKFLLLIFFIVTSIVTLHKTSMLPNKYFSNVLNNNQHIIPPAEKVLKKTIIFDLDGVLCQSNTMRVFYEIGAFTLLTYMIKHGKPSQKDFFNALYTAPAITKQPAYTHGLIIPHIMIDWQTNAQDIKTIQNSMIEHIKSLPSLSPEEKNLHINTALMMTTPEKFIATRQLIQEGIDLVRNLKTLGYKLYILSNWDAPSFELFQKKFPDLFIYQGQKIFDGIIISGNVQMVKPQPEIFEFCLKTFDIKPDEAIFIDDTPENIFEAERLGITSILCNNKNIKNVIQELIVKIN